MIEIIQNLLDFYKIMLKLPNVFNLFAYNFKWKHDS